MRQRPRKLAGYLTYPFENSRFDLQDGVDVQTGMISPTIRIASRQFRPFFEKARPYLGPFAGLGSPGYGVLRWWHFVVERIFDSGDGTSPRRF
jgi:hypothetical protein